MSKLILAAAAILAIVQIIDALPYYNSDCGVSSNKKYQPQQYQQQSYRQQPYRQQPNIRYQPIYPRYKPKPESLSRFERYLMKKLQEKDAESKSAATPHTTPTTPSPTTPPPTTPTPTTTTSTSPAPVP